MYDIIKMAFGGLWMMAMLSFAWCDQSQMNDNNNSLQTKVASFSNEVNSKLADKLLYL